jgi:uncharacterized membrane protein
MALADNTRDALSNLWFLGVILATLSCFISNLGLNLQKLLHLRNQSKASNIREGYHKFALWWLGLLLIVFGAIADFAALTFAPQSLVAPLGSLTLVSNIILSPIILKEVVTTRDIIATLTIVSGCIVAVAFASHDNGVHQLEQLYASFYRTAFLFYAVAVIVFMVFVFVMIHHYEAIENDPVRYTSAKESWHRLSYPALSGTIGAQSVLFAKCLVEMIVDAVHSSQSRFYERWQSYLIIAALIVCIVLQIKWLNDGLIRFDASFEVPVFQAFWVVLSVTSGMIFYREYSTMDVPQLCLFFLGVTITVTGVVMLSHGRRVYRPTIHARSTAARAGTAPNGMPVPRVAPGSSANAHAHGHGPSDLSGLDDTEAELLGGSGGGSSSGGVPGAPGSDKSSFRGCFGENLSVSADRRARLGGAHGYGWVSSALSEAHANPGAPHQPAAGGAYDDSSDEDYGAYAGAGAGAGAAAGAGAGGYERGGGYDRAAGASLGSSLANADFESSEDDTGRSASHLR